MSRQRRNTIIKILPAQLVYLVQNFKLFSRHLQNLFENKVKYRIARGLNTLQAVKKAYITAEIIANNNIGMA